MSYRSVNTLKTEFTKKRGINTKPKNAAWNHSHLLSLKILWN
jgi:hypothetical protein